MAAPQLGLPVEDEHSSHPCLMEDMACHAPGFIGCTLDETQDATVVMKESMVTVRPMGPQRHPGQDMVVGA